MAYCHERKFWEQSKGQKTRKKDKTNEGSRGEGRKKVFGRPGHPPYLRVWLTAPPPPPPPPTYLKVWIRHIYIFHEEHALCYD